MHRMQLQDRVATRANDAVSGRAVADQARVSVLARGLSGLATEAEVAASLRSQEAEVVARRLSGLATEAEVATSLRSQEAEVAALLSNQQRQVARALRGYGYKYSPWSSRPCDHCGAFLLQCESKTLCCA
eukprot:SAG31_NODE_24869_length_472_cov_13.890080_1_plen_129_part_01